MDVDMQGAQEIASRIKVQLAEADRMLKEKKYEQVLPIFMGLNKLLPPPGVAIQIYQCLGALKRWQDMIPYLEQILSVPSISRNAESTKLRYLLGLFYLKYEENAHKARNAWKEALDIAPAFGHRFPSVQSFVSSYDAALKIKKDALDPKVISVNLETGEFAVSLHRQNTDIG